MENQSYQPQPSQPPQGYQPPLQQPVMQQHTDLPPGTLTKHKSGFPALLVGLAVGSLLVGGFLYVTLQAEKSRSAALEQQVADMQKPTMMPKAPAMGTEVEQPGIATASTTPETATAQPGTATNTNLVTYQDKNIPALKFVYDKTKWEVGNGQVGFSTLKRINDKNTVINIIDISRFKDTTEGMYSNAEVSTKKNTVTVGQFMRFNKVLKFHLSDSNSPIYGRYRYYPTKNMFNMLDGSTKYADLKSAFCDSEEYFAGMGSFIDCKIFKTGESIVSFNLKDVLIEYNGQVPQEADEIVKQIKLD